MPSRASSVARDAPPLPPHPSTSSNDGRRPSHGMLQNAKAKPAAKAATTMRLGVSHDLPSSVTHFLCLSSASNTAAAKKELRRQLLVLRDHCVGVSNKTKGKELLSQGGKRVSKKVEASADFNSCLDVIFATSLVFTEETEDVAKDTLRSIVTKLKAVQDCGDDKAFRAAIVEVVNRVLLCTPLLPPARDAAAAATAAAQQEEGEEGEEEESPEMAKEQQHEAAENQADKKKKKSKKHSEEPTEPRLKDECLDFLTMEDGAPVLLESRWRRWLNFFEEGYVRYVEQLMAQQAAEQADSAAAADDVDSDDAGDADAEEAPAAAPLIEAVPYFTARHNYWKSTTSAYAQFCYLLLAIYFVRTKDFSLNYLARVNKLVQYYAYQLDTEDGEPIAVKEGAVEEDDESESEEEEEEEEEEEVAEEEPPRGTEAGVQTETPEPQPEEKDEEKEEEAKEEEEEVVETARSLPPPEYDNTATRRSRHPARQEPASSAAVAPEPAKPPRRRTHKCFTTSELPQELQPTQEAVEEEEAEAAEKDSEEHSHVPKVRRTSKLDIAEVSESRRREREGAEIDEAKQSLEAARDEAAVEALAREAEEQNASVATAQEGEEEKEEEKEEKEEEQAEQAEQAEDAEADEAKNAEEQRNEAVVEALANEAEVQKELEKMASDDDEKKKDEGEQ